MLHAPPAYAQVAYKRVNKTIYLKDLTVSSELRSKETEPRGSTDYPEIRLHSTTCLKVALQQP